jgi:hypothetical protein
MTLNIWGSPFLLDRIMIHKVFLIIIKQQTSFYKRILEVPLLMDLLLIVVNGASI